MFTRAKCKAERKRFGNIMKRDSQKYDVFKVGKRVVKMFRIILVTRNNARNNDGEMPVSDEDKKVA